MKKALLFLLFAIVFSSCSSTDLLIITDIGTDVDDAEAICLAVSDPSVKIIGVACTASDPQLRVEKAKELLTLLGAETIPVGKGAQFIDSLLEKQNRCQVLLIAQATDLSEALETNPSIANKIERIYFQGQAEVDSCEQLVPNPQAFNVSEDLSAAEKLFSFQNEIPFTIVGKYAAYPLVLSRATFDQYEQSGHPAGEWLKRTAIQSNENFALANPEKHHELYPDTRFISNPYDAVAFLTMVMPDCFSPEIVGIHKLIGVSPKQSGIIFSKCTNLQYRLQTIFLSLRAEKIH